MTRARRWKVRRCAPGSFVSRARGESQDDEGAALRVVRKVGMVIEYDLALNISSHRHFNGYCGICQVKNINYNMSK